MTQDPSGGIPPTIPQPLGADNPIFRERTSAQEPSEVSGGSALAIISYAINFIGVPFFLVPFFMRSNAFALYHAKQCMIIWIVALCGGVAATILSFIPFMVCLTVPSYFLVGLMLIVLNIIGLINAINAKAKPIPVIGGWAETMFAGFQKASA